MTKGRLEAFSDGVLAIIITIMVLELKPPHEDSFHALQTLWPIFLSYILSFIYIGIYWNNHHQMLQATQKINGRVLWANAHLLFWLSLVPFVTAWMGENHFTTVPVASYGFVMWMAGFAYFLLAMSLKKVHGDNSAFTKSLGNYRKERLSIILYTTGIALTFVHPLFGCLIYVLIAVIWFVPDKRFGA